MLDTADVLDSDGTTVTQNACHLGGMRSSFIFRLTGCGLLRGPKINRPLVTDHAQGLANAVPRWGRNIGVSSAESEPGK